MKFAVRRLHPLFRKCAPENHLNGFPIIKSELDPQPKGRGE
jgi:hypothetical protein